jgi:hypothetical protein
MQDRQGSPLTCAPFVALVTFAAFGCSSPRAEVGEVQAAGVSSYEPSARVAPSVEPTASSAPATSATPVFPADSGAAIPPGALFVYREGDLALSFTPPRKVTRLAGGTAPCTYELGDSGNMYSGAEIERAWRDAEVQAAVTRTSAFLAPRGVGVASEVRGPSGRIAWTPECGGLCPDGPPGVTRLHGILQVLAVNARAACKL